MSKQSGVAPDGGSVALELLVFGILTPILIVAFALTALASQRTGLQANQIARQTVRLAAGHNLAADNLASLASTQEVQARLEYDLGSADVAISLAKSDSEIGPLYLAAVRLRDHVESAKMLGTK